MKKEIADKWVEALRSGKFKQSKGVLKSISGSGGYCCLGVLCELSNLAEWKVVEGSTFPSYATAEAFVPLVVMDWAGLQSTDGGFGHDEDNLPLTLAIKNDRGASFDAIADIIEKHWEAL